MLESLLTFFCGKNTQKKKKIRQIMKTIEFNPSTMEYTCHSSRFADSIYSIIYSHKAFQWKCNCEASNFKKYETYESPEERSKYIDRRDCIHILAVKIKRVLESEYQSLS